MRTLLMVGVGQTGVPYLHAARALGVRVHAVELAARASTLGELVDGVTVCRGATDELWSEAAVAAAAECRPDGVLAFSEPHVLAAALVADEFGLPGPSLRAAVLSRNKALQRARFAEAGIGQPEYLVVDSLSDARDWASERFPVVVKPLSSAGSAGVELVAGPAAYAETAARRDGEGRLLVERAVSGPEYSWEAIVRDGEVWYANLTAKETTGPPEFVETAHRTAAEVDGPTRAQVDDLGSAVVRALGLRTGITHLEFRLAPTGPSVMEVAVRTPGDHLMDLLGLTYGVDWFELVVRGALGEPLPPAPAGPVRFAASYLPPAVPGEVVSTEGLTAVAEHPCVVSASLNVAPGDRLTAARSSSQRLGQVILAADSRAELEQAMALVEDALVVTVAAPTWETAGGRTTAGGKDA